MIEKIKFENREEWLKIRHKYIGGSDAGAVIGMNPYKSAYTLWAEKTDRIPEFEGNIITKVGAYLEDLVAQMFEEESGKKVRRQNATMVNSKYPFACANVDRVVVGENAVLEIKTTNSLPNMKLLSGGEFPDAWYAQMTHYLAVGEYDRAYLAVLINCREFRVFTLERDEDEIDALMKAEEDFWKLVESDTPPAADGSASSDDTLTLLYPESNEDTVSLDAFGTELDLYQSIGEQIKTLEKRRDDCAGRIKAFMGESGAGITFKYKVLWKSSERRTLDTKALLADHPDIDASKYTKVTSYRTFKVGERKTK